MHILVVEPERKPEARAIDGSLKAMQKIVGGLIQILYPFDEPVTPVCNDEDKLMGLPLNRGLRDEDGKLYDIIRGAFFLCGAPADGDELASLTPEQETFCLERFGVPEMFLWINGRLVYIPMA